jgi:hypothetical protein
MLKWFKNYALESRILPTDTVYILPYEKDYINGIQMLYNDEFCIIENIGVQEFVEALKTFEDLPSFKTDFKSEVERVVNYLNLPQKPLIT